MLIKHLKNVEQVFEKNVKLVFEKMLIVYINDEQVFGKKCWSCI